ncbi:MAG: hypothetical protein DRI57_18120 [Deltaproteobacteria bacterium]|nr:MAG: hypothetical protein DRI57_18120 [Deltaproteobacteria bacterium]
MTRKQLLEALLVSEAPVASLLTALAEFGWDCEEEPVLLRCDHVAAMLRQFLSGEISGRDVSDWADAVEGRDDIGSDEGDEDILTDVIYELANPELTRPLSPETAAEWTFHLGSRRERVTEAGPDMSIGGEKRLIPIDEKLFGRVAEISESEHIPPEALIDLWLKEKISEVGQQIPRV